MTGGTNKCPCELCAKLEKRQKGLDAKTNESYLTFTENIV
jgi:hypothetical protein